jgi:hypothetical protein
MMVYTINDPIRPIDGLPNLHNAELWDHSSAFRMLLQNVNMRD